eukprot:TRINITY_DN62138_c0_g1_i1.p1 TRINITY_DN62138_c0_g1~~TRINITY_DN62138_c0_g1_i1.p1  ORF type:complete len:530 (-),score=91.12 TRINITY_DN62138_c0_g1_i1:82-1671(-)
MSLRGETGWQATYQKAFGKDRWPLLARSLRGDVSYAVLVNRFLPPEDQESLRTEFQLRDHDTIPLTCVGAASAAYTAASREDAEEGVVAPVFTRLPTPAPLAKPPTHIDVASVGPVANGGGDGSTKTTASPEAQSATAEAKQCLETVSESAVRPPAIAEEAATGGITIVPNAAVDSSNGGGKDECSLVSSTAVAGSASSGAAAQEGGTSTVAAAAVDNLSGGGSVVEGGGYSSAPAPLAASAAPAPEDALKMPPELLPSYYLDGASVLAALALGARPGEKVLDLCAAPGGKSLVLATQLFAAPPAPALTASTGEGAVPSGAAATHAWAATAPTGGRLVCNEPSRPRSGRLQRVLDSFLPAELVQAGGRVTVSTSDATASRAPPVPIQKFGPYDRILVDAPCTSDRHLARQGKSALAHWAAGAVKANAERQLELLRCAAGLVRKGGVVLYSTCALSEQENDGVVTKFLKRFGKDFEVERVDSVDSGLVGDLPMPILSGHDRTEHGVLILPDRTPFGPMYIARLRRLGSAK